MTRGLIIIGNLANTHGWFENKVKEYHGDKVRLISEYVGSDRPISLIYHCEIHGDTETTINAKNICKDYFLPCKLCRSTNKSNSSHGGKINKDFYYNRLKEYCKSRSGELLSEKWVTAKTKYKFKCGNPDHPIFESTADALYSGNHWCPYCCGRKGNFEDEIKEIIKNHNGELLSPYINMNTYVSLKCNEHNYIWDIMPLNIKKGRWCPICNLPFSEKVMWDYLNNQGFNVKIQYKFNNLCGENGEKLKYDFAILDKNDNLIWLLEIDDKSHFSKCQSERYKKFRQRDKIKNEYCRNNNIILFRIYYPFDYGNKQPEYKTYYKYIESQYEKNIKPFIKSLEVA